MVGEMNIQLYQLDFGVETQETMKVSDPQLNFQSSKDHGFSFFETNL